MLRYELLMLAVPEITQDETKGLESLIEKTVKDAQGSMISFERWGKYRLAYTVRKSDYGIYFLARFESANTQPLLNEVASLFAIKLNDLVMRHVVTRLEPGQSLAYERPPSVEEAPGRDVDTFLRKNKMGSFAGRRDGARNEAAQTNDWSATEDEDGSDMADMDDEVVS